MWPLLASVSEPKNLKIRCCCRVTRLEGANDPNGMKIPLVEIGVKKHDRKMKTNKYSVLSSFNVRLYVFCRCIQQFVGDRIMADSELVCPNST